jgi:hypothetical protein
MVLLFRLIANVDFRRTSPRSVTGLVLIVPSLGNGPSALEGLRLRG